MFCQRCGGALPVGADFCPNCGIPTRVAPAAPVAPIETCVINLRWQDGPGFVPSRFEADVTGPGGTYIAGQSATSNIIPGDPFWLGTREVRDAHAALVSELTAAGWQVIGQASADWWTTQLRRHLP